MTQELKTIEQNLNPLLDRAGNLQIFDNPTLKEAVTLLSQLNQINDKIALEREKVTKPLNEALKAERARWKPAELKNQQAIDHLRQEMTRYQTAIMKEKQEQEQSIVNKVSTGYIKLDTAVAKLEALPEIVKNVATDAGDVQFREKKQLKITDPSLIPDEYWQINEDELLTDLKSGKLIPGATLETIQVPVNYR